jgi:hypothetical protein
MGTSLFNTTPAATYPALIKVGDNTFIDGTLKTLSDGAGNDLPIQVSSTVTNFTGNVGVGNPAPVGKLDIVSDGGGQFIFSRYGGQPQINIRRSQGTFAAPTAVVGGASSVLNFQNYDGTSFGTSAQIQSVPVENQTTTAKGASLALNVVQQGTTTAINGLVVSGVSTTAGSVSITTSFSAASARLSIWGTALTPTLPYFNIQETGGGKLLEFSNAGNLLVGSSSPSDTAKVSIKGGGSTSASTSLLVQNSLATTTFSVNDAGELSLPSTAPKITLGGDLTITSTVSPTRLMIYDVTNGNLSVNVGGVGEGYFMGNRFTLSRASTTYVTPDALNATGGASITAYDANGNASINASNNGNRSIVLRGLGASGAVLIGNITTANGTSYSAILQADSTTQGFLPPRMTTLQRNAIASPPNGLIVFDTDVQNLCYRRDSTWVQVSFTAV